MAEDDTAIRQTFTFDQNFEPLNKQNKRMYISTPTHTSDGSLQASPHSTRTKTPLSAARKLSAAGERSVPFRMGLSVGMAGIIFLWCCATSALAHQSPPGCTGSGLGILLFTDSPDVHIGDTLNYSITVFNGTGGGAVVCDATSIQAFVVTPDNVSHPIALARTNLSNGQSDYYTNVVS